MAPAERPVSKIEHRREIEVHPGRAQRLAGSTPCRERLAPV
jgi:hypothetical protein